MFIEHIGYGFDKNKLSRDDEIKMNKRLSQTMSKVREIVKSDTCMHCGKSVTSFCNSHNVPRFCLENIEINGEVTGPNAILGLPSMGVSIGKENIGINSSGTFQIICRECDGKIFQDYENPDNYKPNVPPTQKMLAQIAMKNYLKFISKRKTELALYEESKKYCEENGIKSNYHRKKQMAGIDVSKLDLSSYIKDYQTAKKIAEKGDCGYYVIYYKLLNYVTPIAVQAPIVVSIDLDGKIVNDIFNMDPNYTMVDLHLCVFPFETKTAIILFVKDGETRYRNFYKKFRKLNDEEKLGVINYMIFLYSEDYFLSRDIQDKVDLSIFKDVAAKTPIVWSFTPTCNTQDLADEFSLLNWNSIPNLLSEKFKFK